MPGTTQFAGLDKYQDDYLSYMTLDTQERAEFLKASRTHRFTVGGPPFD